MEIIEHKRIEYKGFTMIHHENGWYATKLIKGYPCYVSKNGVLEPDVDNSWFKNEKVLKTVIDGFKTLKERSDT